MIAARVADLIATLTRSGVPEARAVVLADGVTP